MAPKFKLYKMSTTPCAPNNSKQELPLLVTLTGDEDNEAHKTFVFSNEGHTLGNAFRSILSQYPEVEFCGYTVPHPAEAKMNLRIQTTGPPAVDVLKKALQDLSAICDHTTKVFQEQVTSFSKTQKDKTS